MVCLCRCPIIFCIPDEKVEELLVSLLRTKEDDYASDQLFRKWMDGNGNDGGGIVGHMSMLPDDRLVVQCGHMAWRTLLLSFSHAHKKHMNAGLLDT